MWTGVSPSFRVGNSRTLLRRRSTDLTSRGHPPRRESGGYEGICPWTQTGMSIGMMPESQIQSIAGTLTRTQPCDAG
jgi:hypothetical protein